MNAQQSVLKPILCKCKHHQGIFPDHLLISPLRSLFVLPVIGKDGSAISDAATLSGYVGKLEHAFYDLAQNYYHQVFKL